jgi:drug/metabolite transporter (DMT)-like permease
VLAIVLALASAITYGGSDFAAGLASRSVSVVQVSLLASAVSAVIVAAALPFAASPLPTTAALAWGAVAGLGGTLGALALYLGFRHAAFSVAAPISAVGTAGFSVLAGLLLGERPSALALAGIVLALPAIVGVSASAAPADSGTAPADSETAPADSETAPADSETAPADSETAPADSETAPADSGTAPVSGSGRQITGVACGLVAGAFFALLFIGLDRAGSGSGLWPVAATQAGEMVVALAVAVVTGNLALPADQPRRLAAVTGLAGAAGTILFFFATHEGYLAVTAVLGSLYPAVTIVLARVMLGERLTVLRAAGLVMAGACVGLIALGGAG